MGTEVSDLDALIILAVVGFAWLLPILIIIRSNKTAGSEKFAWILIVLFISWFAWIFYMLLAPVKRVVDPTPKSQFAGFILALLFGPFGLFYSSFIAGFTLLIIAIAVGFFTQGVETLAVWPICIIVSFFTVYSHNAGISLEGERRSRNLDSKNSQRIEPEL
jgi:hypothetical protein